MFPQRNRMQSQPYQQQQEEERYQQQHYSRRKIKRLNYGTRTVKLVRASKGFGFTISGQQPCILSCIVPGSPAEIAGLRSGDYLIAVNDCKVGKMPHNDVVRLISRSNRLLQLRIAKSYYSNSSDEEETSAKMRSKPKHRSQSSNDSSCSRLSSSLYPQCRIAKVVKDLQSGVMFDANTSRISILSNFQKWNISNSLPPPPPPSSRNRDCEKIVHRAVLGYLGTIDIPNCLQSVSMMSIIKKCIKRIKDEGRNSNTVLLTIHVANIKLTNIEGRIIAEYPSYQMVYCNSSNEDKLHFAILTKSTNDYTHEVNENHENNKSSNLCHVFKIYSKLIDHVIHVSTCTTFGFTCTKANELDNPCQEFPTNCNDLVGAIQTLYIANTTESEENFFDNRYNYRETQPSPQPSNISTSTAHSSTNDSGIGFKDDCESYSDRNFSTEFLQRYEKIVVSFLERNIKDERKSVLTVQAASDPKYNEFSCVSASSYANQQQVNAGNGSGSAKGNYCEDYSKECTCIFANSRHVCKQKCNNRVQYGDNGVEGNIVSCSAIPSGWIAEHVKPSALVAFAQSPCYTSTMSVRSFAARFSPDSAENIQVSKSTSNFFSMPDRLSPKVYPNDMKVQDESMENLKTIPSFKTQSNYYNTTQSLPHSYTGKVSNKLTRTWGSLQEIRNVANCDLNNDIHGSTKLYNKTTAYKAHSWAENFEKLLEDPKGLQIFAKYLKKEISHENIYFWTACERYSNTQDLAARKRLAAQIYQRHLSPNALEPVNVDSHATSQITLELLNAASTNLFSQAQKQVFNLMKFDSYPRFLGSDIYRKCLETGYDNDTSHDDGDLFLINLPATKIKKSHSDAEDRYKKSILPWYRKNRSKSKDRGESEYNKIPSRGEKIYKSFCTIQRDNEEYVDDDSLSITSSRSSLASWDLALRQSFTKHSDLSCERQSNKKQEAHISKCTGLCRVILPDGSTTVIPTSHSDSVRDVVSRLLEKRALRYSNYDVLILSTEKIVNLKNPSSVLVSQEVEIVPKKVIKIDLPSRRVINIIAHKGRTLKELLKPLLHKYGFKLDLITIWANGYPVPINISAINSPSRLTLTSNSEIIDDIPLFKTPKVSKNQPTLDEITNKVFEELRVGKSSKKYEEDEVSFKSDDKKSESSSNISNKFFSKDSTLILKKKLKSKSNSINEKSNSDCGNNNNNRPYPPLIAKWRTGVKLQLPSKFDGEGLYEGLKRAQRLRLDDQRGIEINSELPEFLKDKKNAKLIEEKKCRKSRVPSGNSECSKFYDSDEKKPILEKSFDSSNSLDETLVDTDKAVIKNGNHESNTTRLCNQDIPKISPAKLSRPPPLPPKPKSLSNSLRNNVLPLRPFQCVINYDKKMI